MKSSLKMTTIALLLGGVLQMQNLAASGVSIDTFQELNNLSGRYSGESGAKTFASDVEKLANTDHSTLRTALQEQILLSPFDASFFAAARKEAKPNTKNLLAFCEGVKLGYFSASGEITTLQSALDELRLTLASQQQRFNDPEIHAFLNPETPADVRPVETLPAFLATGSYAGQLPLAEQMYLLQIRSQLASREGLQTSLNALDGLLISVRNIASNDKARENLVRASFLVDAIPHIKGIVPVIGEYLQSILGKIETIDAAVSARSTMFWRAQPEPLQDLQLRELRARENLAYAIFDALFGTMCKPSSVPSCVAFNSDPKPANILASIVYTMHRSLPATVASQKVTVRNDGTIATVNDVIFAAGIDMSSEHMISVRTATTDFLKKMLAAKEVVKTTFASAALAELSELLSAAASNVIVEEDTIEQEDSESTSGKDLSGGDDSTTASKVLTTNGSGDNPLRDTTA